MTAGGNGNSIAVAQAWSRFLFDGWIRVQVPDPMQEIPTFSAFHLPILVNSSTVVPANDFLSEPLTRKGCMVVGNYHRSPVPLRALAAGSRGVVQRTEAICDTAHIHKYFLVLMRRSTSLRTRER